MDVVEDKKINVDKAVSYIFQAKEEKADIVVLPESFNTPYDEPGESVYVFYSAPELNFVKSLMNLKNFVIAKINISCNHFSDNAEVIPTGETCLALSNAAKKYQIHIIAGSIFEKVGDKCYNTCTVWNPNGELIGKYSKVI